MFRKRSLLLALALATVLATGCGGSASAPATTPPAAAPAAGGNSAPAAKTPMKTTMVVGGRSALVYLPAAVAQYKGFFKDAALDVDVSDAKGGSDAAQALIGGSVEFASMAMDHVIQAKAKGVDLVLVALQTRYPGLTLIVDSKLKDKVKTVKDLKGLRIGVTSLGAGTHLALNALLAKNGMKPEDVQVLAVGSSTMPAAMEGGKIDAAMNADPFVTQLVADGKAYVLFDLTTEQDTKNLYGSDYPFTGLVTSRAMIQKNPELVQRMVDAVVKADQFIAANDAATISALLPADWRQNGDLYNKALTHSKPSLSPDGTVSADGVASVIKALKDAGTLKADASVDPGSIIDMSFAKKSLGK